MITRHIVYLPVRDGTRLIGFSALHTDTPRDVSRAIPIVKDRFGKQHHVQIDQFSSVVAGCVAAFASNPDSAFAPSIVDCEIAIRADRHQPPQWWRDIVGFVEVAIEEFFRAGLLERDKRLARLNENARQILPAVFGKEEGR